MSIQDRDRIRQIGGFVATALGEAWKVDTSAEFNHAVSIKRADDGASVFLRIGPYGPRNGRLIISGEYPGTYDQHRVDRHEITVAADKDPGKIARDIERRLLPDYLPDLEKVRERIAADERAATTRAAALAALGEVGANETNGRIYISLPGIYGQIDLNHDGQAGRIEVGGVPLSGLIAAIKTIRDSLKEAQL